MKLKKVRMNVYEVYEDQYFPFYGLSQNIHPGVAEIEVTQIQAKFIKKALPDFEKVQKLLKNKFQS